MTGRQDAASPVWPDAKPIGLGCMALTGVYGHVDPPTAIATVHAALDTGIEHFDTAELYGPFRNEEVLASALGDSSGRITIATKFGYRLDGGRIAGLDSRPEALRSAVEGSLRRLKRDTIDLLYQHRPDPNVPVEDVVGAMSDLVRAGKVRWLGLSATDAPTLRRGHAVHPISAIQNEYSLLERGPESALLEEAARIGAAFVAYSPLARGRLSGPATTASVRPADDHRRTDSRFADDALAVARPIVDVVSAIGAERRVAPAAIALAWLLSRRPNIRVIPGARNPTQVRSLIAAQHLQLSKDELERLSRALAAK